MYLVCHVAILNPAAAEVRNLEVHTQFRRPFWTSALVRQLQGTYVIPGQPLGLQGNLFSHLSYLKLGLKCPVFYKKSCTEYDWERKCTPNGRHQRSQTKSSFGDDSRQFCVDPNGNRIFGDSSIEDSEIQCRCSRKVWELIQQDRPEQDVMLHCQGT